jgi:hypothetical protein
MEELDERRSLQVKKLKQELYLTAKHLRETQDESPAHEGTEMI